MIYFVGTVPQAAGPEAYQSDLRGLWECERLSGMEEMWEPPILDYLVKDTAEGMGRRLPRLKQQDKAGRFGLLAMFAKSLEGKEPLARVVGYVLWEDRARNSSLLSVAIHPEHRGQGLGRWLVAEVVDLVQRQMGLAPPAETNPERKFLARARAFELGSQLFLKKCGFQCYKSVEGHFDDPPDDGYFFRLQLSPCPKPHQSSALPSSSCPGNSSS